jgi:hypothetical protein
MISAQHPTMERSSLSNQLDDLSLAISTLAPTLSFGFQLSCSASPTIYSGSAGRHRGLTTARERSQASEVPSAAAAVSPTVAPYP